MFSIEEYLTMARECLAEAVQTSVRCAANP